MREPHTWDGQCGANNKKTTPPQKLWIHTTLSHDLSALERFTKYGADKVFFCVKLFFFPFRLLSYYLLQNIVQNLHLKLLRKGVKWLFSQMVNQTLLAPYFVQPSSFVAHVICHYETFWALFKILEKLIESIKECWDVREQMCYNLSE